MKSKTFGSIFILSGTTIGAGLLALPLSSAGLGFVPTVALLLVSYFLTALSSLVILETLSSIPGNKDLHFDSMCRATLGRFGELIFLVAYITLMYSITAAYLSGGSSILNLMMTKLNYPLPDWGSSLIFTGILSCIVYRGARTVDFFNRYIMSVKGIIFLFILFFFLPALKPAYLLDTSGNLPYVAIAVPIIFLVFGYQLIIPSLFVYLEKDIKEMHKVVYIGSFVSLSIFILWLIVSMGTIPRFGDVSLFSFLSTYTSNDIAYFFDLIGKVQPYSGSKELLNIFSNLALITSFLGITLSLKDYFSDTKIIRKSKNKIQIASLLTFLPPLLLVIFKPALFQMALNYAAGMLVVVLLWLPCAMSFSLRKKAAAGKLKLKYKAPGGVLSLYVLISAGVLIFVLSMLATLGFLPTFGANH